MSISKIKPRARGRWIVKGDSEGLPESVRQARDAYNKAVEEATGDKNLSEHGQKAKLLDPAKRVLRSADARRKEIRNRHKAIDDAAENLFRQRRPVAATDSQKKEALMIWEKRDAALAKNDQGTADEIRRLFTEESDDPRTYQLQCAFLSLHPVLLGKVGAQFQELAAIKLGINDLGPQGVEWAAEKEELYDEDEALREVMGAVVNQFGSQPFIESGILPKPLRELTPQERASFMVEHGLGAFRERLADEQRMSLMASAPDITLPDDDAEAGSPALVSA